MIHGTLRLRLFNGAWMESAPDLLQVFVPSPVFRLVLATTKAGSEGMEAALLPPLAADRTGKRGRFRS